MNKYPIDSSELPPGFRYPGDYIAIVDGDDNCDIGEWWLIHIREKSVNFWNKTLRAQYPTRSLVPFAKRSYSDDLACFDGSDTSGHPKVYYVHAYASPGWEHRGEEKTFDDWLKRACEEAKNDD